MICHRKTKSMRTSDCEFKQDLSISSKVVLHPVLNTIEYEVSCKNS
jgi:hypothetical protein